MPPNHAVRCEGTLPRRSFLRASLTGLSTLGLADLLRLEAKARGDSATGSRTGPSSGPSIIVVWLWGGPSHMETFDLKPEAPAEYRGEFQPIETNVPGMLISEHLPKLARIADKYALIRSLSHDSPGHVNSTHTVLTGYTGELVEAPPHKPKYPDLFQASHALLPSRLPGLPQWVALPRLRYSGGAYFGESHGPFSVAADPSAPDFQVPSLSLDEGPRARLAARGRLLDDFDRMRRAVDDSGAVEALDAFQQQALTLLTGTTARDAFDLSGEDPRLRDRYGRDEIGQRCLLARRLVESGVRLVTIDFPCVPGQKAFSWDDHASVWNIFEQMKIRIARARSRGLGFDRGCPRPGARPGHDGRGHGGDEPHSEALQPRRAAWPRTLGEGDVRPALRRGNADGSGDWRHQPERRVPGRPSLPSQRPTGHLVPLPRPRPNRHLSRPDRPSRSLAASW